MKVEVNGNIGDISAMLLSAERYALGRSTYIVEWTCKFIGNNLHLLTEGNKKVMIRDIKQSKEYGWECDKQEWFRLLEKLEEDVNDKC